MAIQRINLGTAPSGTGGDTNRTAFKKIDDNFADTTNAASRLVGEAAGNVMEFGLAGLASNAELYKGGTGGTQDLFNYHQSKSGFFFNNKANIKEAGATIPNFSNYLVTSGFDSGFLAIGNEVTSSKIWAVTGFVDNRGRQYLEFKTTKNTSVDGNGFIKAASPIVKLFADKIELNDEAQQQKITFVKNGVGDYLIKGSTGFAQEGWYIEMPKDANGNVLVAVVYEQLENNDISVKTYAKMFDPDTGDIVANTAKPRDIPATRWIDLRLESLPQPDIKPFSADETVATNAE